MDGVPDEEDDLLLLLLLLSNVNVDDEDEDEVEDGEPHGKCTTCLLNITLSSPS